MPKYTHTHTYIHVHMRILSLQLSRTLKVNICPREYLKVRLPLEATKVPIVVYNVALRDELYANILRRSSPCAATYR